MFLRPRYDPGAVYVFARNGANSVQRAKLSGSLSGANAHFGWALDMDGNLLVVGAPDEAPSAAGAAYVFAWNGTQWVQQTRLSAADASSSDFFGTSVSISGDTIVVGSELADDFGLLNAGASHVFVRNGSVWSQQAKLTPADASAGKNFGKSLSLRGESLVVGAEGDGTNAGAAYLFVRNRTNWFQRKKITASDASANAAFGAAVALARVSTMPARSSARGCSWTRFDG